MFHIDDHVDIAIAGLTSDSHVLRYVPLNLKARQEVRKRERPPALFSSFSLLPAAISCASKPWARRQCSTVPSTSTASYPISPTVHHIPLGATKLTCRPRGPGEYTRHRPATVWRRLRYRWTGQHRPTTIRFLAERHIHRVLLRLDC